MFRTLTYLAYFFTCKTNKTSTIHRSAYSVIYMFNNLSNHRLITNVQRNPALTSLQKAYDRNCTTRIYSVEKRIKCSHVGFQLRSRKDRESDDLIPIPLPSRGASMNYDTHTYEPSCSRFCTLIPIATSRHVSIYRSIDRSVKQPFWIWSVFLVHLRGLFERNVEAIRHRSLRARGFQCPC